jgi:hypothetical protein
MKDLMVRLLALSEDRAKGVAAIASPAKRACDSYRTTENGKMAVGTANERKK